MLHGQPGCDVASWDPVRRTVGRNASMPADFDDRTRRWWRIDAPQHVLYDQANVAALHRERWPLDRHPADWRRPPVPHTARSDWRIATSPQQQLPTVASVLRGPDMGLWHSFPAAPQTEIKPEPRHSRAAPGLTSATELIPGTSIKAQAAEMQRAKLRRNMAALRSETCVEVV